MKYISAWSSYTGGISAILAEAVENEEVQESDTVWAGPDGSYLVGWPDDEEYAEFSDAGQVADFIHDDS